MMVALCVFRCPFNVMFIRKLVLSLLVNLDRRV
jgi:hypothetical protein